MTARDVLRDTLDKPSAARVYDYLLGGTNNYAIDREFAQRQIELTPHLPVLAQTNRAFLRRTVEYALGCGITQFVDIGAGLPTQECVHEIAEKHVPGQARVVYVDNDPLCRAHSEILLSDTADTQRHAAICADYTDAEELWQQVVDCGLIDLRKPIALLLVSVLHFVREAAPALHYYRHCLPPGSLLIFNHFLESADNSQGVQEVTKNYTRETINQVHPRGVEEILALTANWPLAEPGLVPMQDWRPVSGDPDPAGMGALLGCVARKPG